MGETIEHVATALDELRKSVDTRFTAVDTRFDAVDQRLDGVDKRLDGVDRRLDGVDKRLGALVTEIRAEAEKTRRHFDVVAEQMKSERNLALDKGIATGERLARLRAANAAAHAVLEKRLDNHEQRLAKLEKS